MVRTIAAVSGGVALGLVIAFANAGAFPFWSDSASSPGARVSPGAPLAEADQVQANQMQPQPAPANEPEPNEKIVGLPSWAPLVKRVMPTVVNVAVVQEVNPRLGGDDEDQGGGDNGGGGGGVPTIKDQALDRALVQAPTWVRKAVVGVTHSVKVIRLAAVAAKVILLSSSNISLARCHRSITTKLILLL